jgi:SAM-dependent methyltransferase
MKEILVQYGCGLCAPVQWRNFDASPTLRLQRLPLAGRLLAQGRVVFPANAEYGDVVSGLPIADQACSAVYCSHVLEHLSLEDFRKALRETYRILKPGGTFRGVLPDMEIMIRDYVSDSSPDAAQRFMNATLLGVRDHRHGIRHAFEDAFGNARHLWMWDFKGLAQELARAGFRNIRRASFGDNAAPYFPAVEVKERWHDSLGFECLR